MKEDDDRSGQGQPGWVTKLLFAALGVLTVSFWGGVIFLTFLAVQP